MANKINIAREIRLNILELLRIVPDRMMIKIQFRMKMKNKLNLENPKTFNEKLQWLKLFDRKENHTKLVDKLAVRDYVKQVVGEEYLIPLLGAWRTYKEIDFNSLPETFVMKCNHDSGSIQIIDNKNEIDHKELNRFFTARLRRNPYASGREWPYKNVSPCIVVEKNMATSDGSLPVDYKFFCYDGFVDSVMICTDRGFSNKRFFFFDKEWKLRKYNKSSLDLPDDFQIEKPKEIDALFELASKLSKGERFVRIDFYIIGGQPYFGEFTYFPASGYDSNILPWADEHLGNLIKID